MSRVRSATGDLRRFLDTYRQVSSALFEPQDRLAVAAALVGPVRQALGAERAVVFTTVPLDPEPTQPGRAPRPTTAVPAPLVGTARPGDDAMVAEAFAAQRVVGPGEGSGGEVVVAIPLADAHGPLGAVLYGFGPAGPAPVPAPAAARDPDAQDPGVLDGMWFDALAVECREAMERGRLWEVKRALRDQAQRDGLRVESSERQLRRVLDGLFVFVGLLAADGTLLEANRAALEAGGLEPDDVVGRPFWEAYWWSWNAAVQAQLRAAVARAAAGVASRYDVEVRMAGGRLITIDFQLAPLYDDDGVVTHLVPSGLDISDRKHQEAELERRLRSEQRARERAEALQQLAEALGAASDSVEVYDAVAGSAAAAMGARFANLAVRTEVPGQVALYNGPGLPGDMAQRWSTVSVDSPTPIGAAFRSSAMVWAPDPMAIEAQFPAGSGDAAAAGLQALGAVPVTSAEAEVVAVIGLAWGEPQPLTAELHASLSALSAVVGQALERARRFDAERHVAQALQQVLLPATLPDLPTMSLTARYLAAESTLAVGGDWYECFELSEGRLIIALGDVVGRGLEAAATVGQLRAAVAALAATVDSPAALLDRLDGFVRHFPGAVCTTVVCVELTLETGAFRYACAGHPPPLLVRPDGTTTLLDGGRSTPIGISAGARPFAEHRLEAGERLLLYTDGLVERRGERIDCGFDRLQRAASTLAPRRDDGPFLDEVIAATVPEASSDDVCLLLVHRLAPPRTLGVVVRDGAAGLSVARHALRDWLAEAGIPDRIIDDAVLAAGEAMANAVEHAYLEPAEGRRADRPSADRQRAESGSDGEVRLAAALVDGVLELTVSDDGSWRHEAAPGPRGRGLGLMRLVMDEVVLTASSTGTRVAMRRSLEVRS